MTDKDEKEVNKAIAALGKYLNGSTREVLDVMSALYVSAPEAINLRNRHTKCDEWIRGYFTHNLVDEPDHRCDCQECSIGADLVRRYTRQEAVSLRKLDYYDYLLTPHWDYIRRAKLREASNRCELCFSKERLNVHHKTYERLGMEKLSDLIVLCHECHTKVHEKLAGDLQYMEAQDEDMEVEEDLGYVDGDTDGEAGGNIFG
jgi:5-methylcytosine-specific restriction endonuclease McrA